MSRKSELKELVGKKISLLQSGAELSSGRAMLAKLRRGIGHEPGEMPQILGMILMDMPEEFLSRNGEATKEEWVCYVCLTLYALHQQGNDAQNAKMHTKEKVSVGKAMAKLAASYDDSNAEERILQRLQKLTTAIDMNELSYHLRSFIQLLKSKGIPLNYELLAGDLYELQFPDVKRQVCLRWGQDYYGSENKTEEEN